MRKVRMKMRKGAASFYVVAFSTLILVIIAASFTAVVLSEMVRTANDDLSQSAYDSALAGVEDAKLAFYNYQKCVGSEPRTPDPGNGITCNEIVYWMSNPDCDMVARILGRIGEIDVGSEVIIEESSGGASGSVNNMQQAYTCVEVNTILSDYRSTLTSSDSTKAIKVKLGDGVTAEEIDKVKISWFSEEDYSTSGTFEPKYSNFNDAGRVAFPSANESAIPPMISVGLIQTAPSFSLTDFERVDGGTNRGTVFLVPTDKMNIAGGGASDNYIGIYKDGKNVIGSSLLVKSNDTTVKNLPLTVFCDGSNSEFYCSADMELPRVVGGGSRSDDTFMIVVSLPYGQPNTSFALEFYKNGSDKPITLDGMQVEVDSTGRANNLYRRVEVRLDPADANFPYPLYAIEALGNDSDGSLIKKPDGVTCEYNFGGPTC